VLQHEMKFLSRFPNIVFYSSQGMQWASEAQSALNAFLPNNKLLIAYLNYNSKGIATGSHLLMDEGRQEVAIGPQISPPTHEKKPLSQSVPKGTNPAKTFPKTAGTDSASSRVDKNHPLLLQLIAIKGQRDQTLSEFESDLLVLLNTPNRT